MTRWMSWDCISEFPYVTYTFNQTNTVQYGGKFQNVREYMKWLRTRNPQYDWKSVKLSGNYGWEILRTRWPRDEE